ncbi:MAG: diguanylate cyclase domain-containing protein [Gaiellaceae bacterium]
MTPTIAQRLGFRPFRPSTEEGRRLAAARAASALFALQPTVALAAAASHDQLTSPALAAAALSYPHALVVLLAYEQLGAAGKALTAVGGSLVVATFVIFQAHGELYSVLYGGIVLFVCFFFPTGRAIAQVLFVLVLSALAAVVAARGLVAAVDVLILETGAFAVAAAITISLRRRLGGALARAELTSATLDAFFVHASTGFAFLDSELRRVRVNEPLATMLGIPAEKLTGSTVGEIAPHLAGALEPLLRGVLETGRPLENLELASRDGRRHYLVSYYTVIAADGTLGLGETVVEVTHLKDVEQRLEETNRRLTVLATTDELTGLPNRRMLAEQLDLALARARRSGLGVAVLCLDLDGFMGVNDTLGHSYGDDLLVAVAAKLRAGARDTDVVARLGGDEFVVLLADLDVQDAPALAETVVGRIHAALEEPIAIGPVELKVDASIGVAIYPLDSRDARGLLAVADAAMYAGKTSLTQVA